MINANNHWDIIEAAYEKLQDAKNLPIERPADPQDLRDYDLADAIDQTAYEITGVRYPEIALLEAFAREGYLDDDQIWDEIGEALGRALEGYAEYRYQDYQDSLNEPEEYWA